MSASTMAAARQNEMKDNITVVATTTFTAPGRCSNVTEFSPRSPCGDFQMRLRG
jgi:hypothetical protein